MTFAWPRKRQPLPRDANKAREQKTVVINRKANAVTGLFGGSLMWTVEALAAAPQILPLLPGVQRFI